MSKYIKLNDYEGFEVNPKEETLRFACCDCGLVHDLGLAHEENGKIGMAFKRHNRATAQLRRHKFGNLQNKNKSKYRIVDLK